MYILPGILIIYIGLYNCQTLISKTGKLNQDVPLQCTGLRKRSITPGGVYAVDEIPEHFTTDR